MKFCSFIYLPNFLDLTKKWILNIKFDSNIHDMENPKSTATFPANVQILVLSNIPVPLKAVKLHAI